MEFQNLSVDDLQSYATQLRMMGTKEKTSMSFFFAHGFVFFFAWIFFALIQIFSARYYKHKWETNMVVHTASGCLITFATMFWGFWAVKLKSIKVIDKVNANNVTSAGMQGSGLHDYPGIATALMAVPVMISGFIPYFRRWQADGGATQLVNLKDFHKVIF